MDTKRKSELNNRIIASVHKYKLKKQIQNIYVASSLLFFIGIGTMLYIKNQVTTSFSTIQEHANALHIDFSTTDNIKLILNNEQEVPINKNNAEISYSKSGETISIKDDKSIKQVSEHKTQLSYNTIIVPYGKQSKISLSDGSEIWLNSGTKLTYPVVFNTKKREVYLEGEAIFEVTHNKLKPFHVVTSDYEVKVLGTIFNVSSYPDDDNTTTALESGSVEIQIPSPINTNNNLTKITPGTLATLVKDKNQLTTKKVNISKYMSWRDGVFTFENDNLSQILKKVSRHYKVVISIENKNLEIRTFSGTLDMSDKLEQVLDILKKTADFDYQINYQQVNIHLTK